LGDHEGGGSVSKEKDGGPAFTGTASKRKPYSNEFELHPVSGMSLRDYFAAKAMQSLIPNIKWGKEGFFDELTIGAYNVADAMLESRKK
jgi:hypothetical protein